MARKRVQTPDTEALERARQLTVDLLVWFTERNPNHADTMQALTVIAATSILLTHETTEARMACAAAFGGFLVERLGDVRLVTDDDVTTTVQ